MEKLDPNRRKPESAALKQMATPEAQEAMAANMAFGHPGAGKENDAGADLLEEMRTIANLHGS